MRSLLPSGTAFSKAFMSTLLWQATQIRPESYIVHRPFTIFTRVIGVTYISDVDIEQRKSMKVEELQSFLRLRRLRATGKKDELVATAFVAIENDVPILQTAEEAKIEIEGEYHHKLKVLDELLPDPLHLKEGSLSEEESVIKYRPIALYPYIFKFLAFHPTKLATKDLSDYKTSKACNY